METDKTKDSAFGKAEMQAHKRANEKFGAHFALADAATALRSEPASPAPSAGEQEKPSPTKEAQ